MRRLLLISAGLALGLSASAQTGTVRDYKSVAPVLSEKTTVVKAERKEAKLNDGTNSRTPSKAASTPVQWKRPAGQFWGTGYAVESNSAWYYYTPLCLRPWVDYTFENVSTVTKGTPTWEVEFFDTKAGEYTSKTIQNENTITQSWIQYEQCNTPVLSYARQVPYPTQYEAKGKETGYMLELCVRERCEMNTRDYGRQTQPVSSHYYSGFARNKIENTPFTYYTGADPYEGEEDGYWFGTNNRGYNAQATRFEKPDMPYLLNGVYWYYMFEGTLQEDLPLKAYVFKTANDAAIKTTSSGTEFEVLELGELIATAETVLPAGLSAEDEEYSGHGMAHFEFVEKNPVTGAETAISLEISDDITIIVAGYDKYLGPNTFVSSLLSNDDIDEGYGNLGFLGWIEETEDGSISYNMPALHNFFRDPLPNTVLGVLADVSYPWINDYYVEQPREVKLPNSGETTETQQGLQYALWMLSTSETSDMQVTFNGEEECDWLEIIDVFDEYEENEEGEEEYTGACAIAFQAAPNPEDVNRTCVVEISIPAATYKMVFLQGSGNNAVEIVGVEGEAQYFDLAGRRVVNPGKGLYIKTNGKKAEKVVL